MFMLYMRHVNLELMVVFKSLINVNLGCKNYFNFFLYILFYCHAIYLLTLYMLLLLFYFNRVKLFLNFLKNLMNINEIFKKLKIFFKYIFLK